MRVVTLACVAFGLLQVATVAQTIANPGGFRGSPMVTGPIGGPINPVGGGLKLEPMKVDLTPTLPVVSAPTVRTGQSAGSPNVDSEVPKHPRSTPPPPEPDTEGDAAAPGGAGAPKLDLLPPLGGQGEPGSSAPPTTSSQPGSGVPWWIVIGVGLLAVMLYRAKHGRSGY